MARVSMKDRVGAVKPVEIAPTPPPAEAEVVAEAPVAMARVNFEIPRSKHTAFKAMCAANGVSIKDELTAYIDSRLR